MTLCNCYKIITFAADLHTCLDSYSYVTRSDNDNKGKVLNRQVRRNAARRVPDASIPKMFRRDLFLSIMVYR